MAIDELQPGCPQSQGVLCESTSGDLAQSDEDTPILLRVGCLGMHYRAWVHRPVKGRPRFFQNSALESVTKTPWWVVPALWGPTLCLCLALSLRRAHSASEVWVLYAIGAVTWQLMEYVIHRWVFHRIPENYWGITAHFLFHGCHHKFPTDTTRLVFPPLPAAGVALGVYSCLKASLPQEAALPVFSGIASGYLAYDCLHYCLHHSNKKDWLSCLRAAHLQHHYRKPDSGFGISSPLFDVVFGSLPGSS